MYLWLKGVHQSKLLITFLYLRRTENDDVSDFVCVYLCTSVFLSTCWNTPRLRMFPNLGGCFLWHFLINCAVFASTVIKSWYVTLPQDYFWCCATCVSCGLLMHFHTGRWRQWYRSSFCFYYQDEVEGKWERLFRRSDGDNDDDGNIYDVVLSLSATLQICRFVWVWFQGYTLCRNGKNSFSKQKCEKIVWKG